MKTFLLATIMLGLVGGMSFALVGLMLREPGVILFSGLIVIVSILILAVEVQNEKVDYEIKPTITLGGKNERTD